MLFRSAHPQRVGVIGQVLPDDPYSLGMRALAAFHLATGGYGQAQEVIGARTGVIVGRAQLAGLAGDLAAWTDDFYSGRARDAEEEEQPDSDVIMMQADGKGIALRPEHRKGGGADAAHPGIKKMAEVVAVADFTPAVREPGDIAAPPARRPVLDGHAGPGRPSPGRQRVFLVDGNKQQITAIEAQAAGRGLKVPVLIDYIHVSGLSAARPPPRCTPATPSPPGSGPTGNCSASCTAARRPSPPPSPPSPPRPARTPAPATSTWPAWTRPSPT